jgi:hypothetical protein
LINPVVQEVIELFRAERVDSDKTVADYATPGGAWACCGEASSAFLTEKGASMTGIRALYQVEEHEEPLPDMANPEEREPVGDWVYMGAWGSLNALICERCGAKEEFRLPMQESILKERVETFSNKHRDCKE